MWKHYDNLRQEKNKMFLTANTILVAVVGFLISKHVVLVCVIAVLGFVVCVLWLLLQSINKAYIDYHIKTTIKLEENQVISSTTFSNQQRQMIGVYKYANSIDRILSGTIALFWAGISAYFLSKIC